MTAFQFTLQRNDRVEACVRRHLGARRFAFNQCLAGVKDALGKRRADPSAVVPWSGFSLVNYFNAWKKTEQAGRRFAVDPSGTAELVDVGLSWRDEVCAQVFEEAAIDLGRALDAFAKSKKGDRKGPRVGFPHYKKKRSASDSFRLRNRVSSKGGSSIRVGAEGGPRSVTLPVIGTVEVIQDTRRLRRLLRPNADGSARARLYYAHGGGTPRPSDPHPHGRRSRVPPWHAPRPQTPDQLEQLHRNRSRASRLRRRRQGRRARGRPSPTHQGDERGRFPS